MSLFGSIIDQSQEYYSFSDGPLIILWCKLTVNKCLTDQLIVQL